MFDKEGRLDIFEEFQVDWNLPKYQDSHPEEEMSSSNTLPSQMSSRRRRVRTPFSHHSGLFAREASGSLIGVGEDPLYQMELTAVQRFLLWAISFFSPPDKLLAWHPLKNPPPKPQEPTLSILEFFEGLKDAGDPLPLVRERARGYEEALKRAKQTGQTALGEQLEAGLEAARAETRLHAIGKIQVLSEATLVEFVKKCPKGLRLDWIKNFTRHIPDDVLKEKLICDGEQIFDNYVVLHYDPDAKSWAETQAERAARKDPILFGLIAGRRMLYFVGDWVDEYCDLTLDEVADLLGKEAVEEVPLDSLDDSQRDSPRSEGCSGVRGGVRAR